MNFFPRLNLMVLIFVFCLFSSCVDEERKKLDYFEKGNKYFNSKEFKKAEIEFKNALKIDSSYLDALVMFGETMLKLGQGQKAFNVYSKVEELSPDNRKALLNLAKFYFLGKNSNESLLRISKVLKSDPHNIDALLLKSQILLSKRKIEDASEILRKIVILEEDNVHALHTLARIRTLEKNFTDAEKLLLKAVESDPKALYTRSTLANYYILRKEYDKAEKQLQIAVDSNPENQNALIILGNFYLRNKKLNLAEENYTRAAGLDGEKLNGQLTLARFYEITGNDQKSRNAYNKALEKDPENINAKINFANYNFKKRRIEDAEKIVDSILSKRPNIFSAKILKSKILYSKKEYKKAIALLSSLEKDEPRSHGIKYYLGLANLGLGNIDQASIFMTEAVEINPAYSKARLLLAEIYFRQKSFELSENQTLAILKQNPLNTKALMLNSRACLEMGKIHKAESNLKKIIEIEPENSFAYFRLAQIKISSKEFKDAEKLLHKAGELNPKIIDPFALIVNLKLSENKIKQAHDLCQKKLKNSEDKKFKALVYNIQASVFMFEKKYNKAMESYQNAIALFPDFLPPYGSIAKIYLMERKLDEAIVLYKKVLEKKEMVSSHMMLGAIYDIKKEFKKASTHYRKALEINPEFAPAANNLAYHLAKRTGNYDEALKYATKAKGIFPEDPAIMDTLGMVYLKKGLYKNAREEFKDSLEKIQNPVVSYHLALAYYKTGEEELAIKEIEKALKSNKDFEDQEMAKKLLAQLKKGEKNE